MRVYFLIIILFCSATFAQDIAKEATRLADNATKNLIERDRKIVLDGVINRATDGRRSITYRFSNGNKDTLEKDMEHAKRVAKEIEKEGFEVKVYKDLRKRFERTLVGNLDYDVVIENELVLMDVRWK